MLRYFKVVKNNLRKSANNIIDHEYSEKIENIIDFDLSFFHSYYNSLAK